MRKFAMIFILALVITGAGCSHKLGTFSVISTEQNLNTSNLKLKQAAVTDKIKFKRTDCLQKSVSFMLNKYQAQAIYNAQIRQNWTGNKIIITGDLYAY